MKKLQYFVISFLSIGILFVSYERVSAASWLPKQIQDLFGLMGPSGTGVAGFATSRVQMILLLGLGALILAAVVYAAMAALKYIQSAGDPGKIEEAGKAVKAIFTGLAVLMVAIVGIVLVFVFFGTGLFDSSAYQVCASAADSRGCISCKADSSDPLGKGGVGKTWDTDKFSTGMPATGLLAAPGAGVGGATNEQLCIACEWCYFQLSKTGTLPADCTAGGPPTNFEVYCKE